METPRATDAASRLRRAACALGALALVLGPASSGADAEDADRLVRSVWFEGLPLEQASGLDADAGERLAAILADPTEAAHHPNAALALGACACGPAYEALAAFEAHASPATASGRAAQFALPQAMGLLARRDPRALDWLEARAITAAPPGPDRAAHHRTIAVVEGLAAAATPRATAALRRLEADAAVRGDAVLQRRLRRAISRAEAGP